VKSAHSGLPREGEGRGKQEIGLRESRQYRDMCVFVGGAVKSLEDFRPAHARHATSEH
jgi:hypothetical protein